ncbi:hypothetical protein JYU34_000055 [Plutella xylostella]|uniref:procollagen-lysine 5-dioxygenase n=1 Tax=Plutella xylostella TaxID=51655 RepID=A0ABQ7R6Q7_PLUXY|nr:hypothetical protein JYU34_000055 [Plutella xylostella]
MKKFVFFVHCVVLLLASCLAKNSSEKVVVLTVATDDNHGLQRFLRSAKVYNIDVEVLGMGRKWTGGNMDFPGGGMKVNLLKEKLTTLDMKEDTIVLFTDSYDVMYLSELPEIVKRFKSFPETRFCSRPSSTAGRTPRSPPSYLSELLEIVQLKAVEDSDDDQLFYTGVYLDPATRDSFKINLDHDAQIFQNLNGVLSDIQLNTNTTEEWPFINNTVTKQRPLLVHGNGPAKLTLNQLGNYLAHSWSPTNGCELCKEKKLEIKEEDLPTVLLSVFIEQPTPFLEEFLQQLLDLSYPQEKLHLFLRNNEPYHEELVDKFFKEHSDKYISAKRVKPSDFLNEAEARKLATERCLNTACEFIFSIDSVARVDKNTLRYLVTSGYDVIAPKIMRPGLAWSNFWGAVNSAGFYARSTDYMDIAYNVIKGIWNVPFITNVYLVKSSVLRKYSGKVTYSRPEVDPDMAFCQSLREAGIFMHVSNEFQFGHLVNPESYDVTKTHPDVYQVIDNKEEWEARYLHPDYAMNFEDNRTHLQPCPDVYWFPLMSQRFCVEWIAIMEAYGKWSAGDNKDDRLPGGYEAVPTRDIHMSQVGLERQWLHILKEYVRPLQEMVFIGYYHNPPVSVMNFVVRYRPDEQPSLRPHHDASTYTINLALNTPHVDYEGGGCKFLRYDCSVRDTRQGWLLMHPGRVTHYHEGLQVTNGTRYIMISFVDP